MAYHTIVKRALRERFPAVSERAEKKQLSALISFGAALRLKEAVNANPSLVGLRATLLAAAAAKAEAYLKGAVDSAVPESQRRISDRQVAWLVELKSADQTQLSFNRRFLPTPIRATRNWPVSKPRLSVRRCLCWWLFGFVSDCRVRGFIFGNVCAAQQMV